LGRKPGFNCSILEEPFKFVHEMIRLKLKWFRGNTLATSLRSHLYELMPATP